MAKPNQDDLFNQFYLYSEDIRCRIFNFIQNIYNNGVCIRCCIRFLCLHNVQLFNLSEDELYDFIHFIHKKTNNNFNLKKRKEFIICTLCLGIIQDSESHIGLKYIKLLQDSLQNCGYSYKNFQFCLTLPFSCIIRELAIMKQFNSEIDNINNENIPSIKEVFKWLTALSMPVKFKKESKFTISTSFTNIIEDNDLKSFSPVKQKKTRKQRFQKKYIPKSVHTLRSITDQMDKKSLIDLKNENILPLQPISSSTIINIKYEYAYVYVAGRYNKYSRTLSQSPWLIDGVRKSESSVEELIAEKIVQLYKADGFTFSSAGREDIDVRMLGNGRPFLIEIHNPRNAYVTNDELANIEKQINLSTKLIQIQDLQKVKKKESNNLKEGEEYKKKTYRCIVYVSNILSDDKINILNSLSEKEFEIQQETPIRVLHRRTLLTRAKKIHKLKYEIINPNFLILDLETQAGTYIKEFIHGDLGRTNPNLGSLLGCEADILQLDVLSIVFDWPPILNR